MKKPTKTYLRNKADALVSKFCRSKGYCERCGARDNLQWCHFLSRRYLKVRYFPPNYACLCARCHFFLDENPDKKVQWWELKRGKDAVKLIRSEANKSGTITPAFYENVIKDYESLVEIKI